MLLSHWQIKSSQLEAGTLTIKSYVSYCVLAGTMAKASGISKATTCTSTVDIKPLLIRSRPEVVQNEDVLWPTLSTSQLIIQIATTTACPKKSVTLTISENIPKPQNKFWNFFNCTDTPNPWTKHLEFDVNSLTHHCTTSKVYFVVLVYFQK